MTRAEIQTLLGSQDIEFRRVALEEIVMSFPTYSDLFFAAFHEDGEPAVEMANAARQWMPALRDGFSRQMAPFESAEDYSTFRNLAESYSLFLREMHKDLDQLDEAAAQRAMDTLWYYFPGLRVDLKGEADNLTPEEHRQLIVFVTGRCNLHCPYCFSKELERLSISKTDMERVLSWAQRQGVHSMLPCGGEPLLYEHMDWLIQEARKRDIKIYFATNLSLPLTPGILEGGDNIGMLYVHLTYELFRNTRLMNTFRNNLRLCREHRINVMLRGNIFDEAGAAHYDEWFAIAQEFDIHALNVAFTIPSHTGSNSFVQIEALRSMVPHLEHIWAQGRKLGIRISLAKPVPLCILPEEMAMDVLRHNHNAAFCNVSEDGGMHNLSLSTDLRFSPCLGVDKPSVPFADDLEWDDLRKVFGHAVAQLQNQPLLDRCNSCFLYQRRLCQGACLSYKQDCRNGGVSCVD